MRKSSVDARSCMPSAVRLSSSTMPTSRTIVTIQVAISRREKSTPLTSNWFVSHGYGSTVRGEPGGKIMYASFCSPIESANDVISSVLGEARLTGRNAISSISSANTITLANVSSTIASQP